MEGDNDLWADSDDLDSEEEAAAYAQIHHGRTPGITPTPSRGVTSPTRSPTLEPDSASGSTSDDGDSVRTDPSPHTSRTVSSKAETTGASTTDTVAAPSGEGSSVNGHAAYTVDEDAESFEGWASDDVTSDDDEEGSPSQDE